MNRLLAGLAVALGLTPAATAWAAPPSITATSPYGVRRGVATEVTIDGTHLKGTPELVAPFGVSMKPQSAPNGDDGHWKATITVAPETAVGVYPIRVRNENGISNPLLFSVGQLPQVVEAEDNNTFEAAQKVPTPAVVEGQTAGNDVDYFRFSGKKGERVVVDAQCARIGSGVDPTLRLLTVGHAYVASADDTAGLLTDARLWATLPEDTDYVVELSDSRYQGGGRAIYRLVVGPVPMAEEVYPIGGRRGDTVGVEVRGGTLPALGIAATTLDPSAPFDSSPLRVTVPGNPSSPGDCLDVESLTPLITGEIPEHREPADPGAAPVRAAVPAALNGRIDPAGDEDRFVLAVTPGQKLRIEVDASDHGSALDGILQVLDAKGKVLVSADDTAAPKPAKGKAPAISSPDPTLDFTVPAGLSEVTLAFRDLESRGGTGFAYRIRVVPETDSFEVVLDDPQVSIPRGGTAAVGVTVVRKGYNGPITLSVPNLPPGLSVRPGTIAAKQVAGSLTLSATSDASFGAVQLPVIGEGQGPGGPIVAPARKTIVFASLGTFATSKKTQIGLAAAPASPSPVTLEAPEGPVEVAHGFGGAFPIKVHRRDGADAELKVATLPLPTGLSLAEAKIAAKQGEANLVLNVAPEAALGTLTIAVVARGKFEGAEETIAAPEITLNVVRPAALELASPGIEIKPGDSVEVKGKVVRKGTFKEEVTVQLNKLPAGLKAEPVKVAPDRSEFAIKIDVDPKAPMADPTAPIADGKAEVALVFQVAKKDYPVPPTPLSIKFNAAR